ncbi:AAA family ATPase [Marinobacterium sp. D7]|uniref:bifunctional aminoglycoside phosphotransferase/ATP-binding protein n=1 Tax=Marinobacterium ramblicola TaxID=2849041 RepID=UPI001C2D8C5A|nr:bifunctional aminoglycoside phosphotransferase/ATP-binding protein [Marinobacterium ramblicola]MBV1788908.1 AAA family ATPase [Marinobacterium ramblicola]
MVPELIERLCLAEQYPHPVSNIEVIETHISWLLLTGDYAYKIKKPVDFGFLDFTTLDKRRYCCEEELRLNQRLAPDIYEAVVPISGSESSPHLGDDSAPIEYAVRMRQFESGQRLDQLLERHQFQAEWIDLLAAQIAHFHKRIPFVSPDSPWGEPDTIAGVVFDNYHHINRELLESEDVALLDQLEAYTRQQFEALRETMIARKRTGRVRECHGDLHLGNVTLYHDQLRLFDCIEFNLQFRWIDTICDLAFLLMDLEANGQFRWANRLLNLYLELSGDYEGLVLLNFYKSYRSMVRAKVAMLGDKPDVNTFRHYLQLTKRYCTPKPPFLLLMHGVSGTGKSYLSKRLFEAMGAVRIRSDVERKRIYRSASRSEKLELYGSDMNLRTFNRLLDTTRLMLRAGVSVVVDATFIRKRGRHLFRQMSEREKVPMRIISCHCDQKLIEARLKRRSEEGNDPSDADIEVMRHQLSILQPITAEEQLLMLEVDTRDDEAIEQLLSQLRAQKLMDD